MHEPQISETDRERIAAYQRQLDAEVGHWAHAVVGFQLSRRRFFMRLTGTVVRDGLVYRVSVKETIYTPGGVPAALEKAGRAFLGARGDLLSKKQTPAA